MQSNKNSVGYILGFCAAVCLACSIIVSSAAVGLKDRQEQNKQLDRQKKVLTVAGLIKENQSVTPKQVQDLFKKRIKSVLVDLQKGIIDAKATLKAKAFDQQKARNNPKTSRKAKKNLAGVARIPNHALVYLVSKKDMKSNGAGFELSQYIFPVEGKGLWSTMLGFIALQPDFNEIRGLTFYAHGETPGLGGEVDNPAWKAKWPGRMVFGPKGSASASWKGVKIQVIKGTTGSPKKAPHQVDGLSGATITSKGVTYLLHFWLGKQGFGRFIKNKLSGVKAPAKRTVAPKKAAPKKAAKKAVAPAKAAPKKVAPVKAPAKVAPKKVAPAKVVVPAKVAPKKVRVAPVKAAPKKIAPAKAAPVKVTPKKAVVPVKVAPAKVAPAKVAPAKVVPKKAAPVKVAPKKVVPVKVVPKKVAPKKAVAPTKVAPKKAAPAKVAPKKAVAPTKAAPKQAASKKVVAPVKVAPKQAAAPVKRAAVPVKRTSPRPAPRKREGGAK